MKRKPLRRLTPLRRRTWLRSRGDTKYRRRPRDLEYMQWVRTQPCCAVGMVSHKSPCDGPIEADHAGRRGMRQKADDRTCIPLCRKHHHERGSFSGGFRDWDQSGMRHWLVVMISRHQARYDETVIPSCQCN